METEKNTNYLHIGAWGALFIFVGIAGFLYMGNNTEDIIEQEDPIIVNSEISLINNIPNTGISIDYVSYEEAVESDKNMYEMFHQVKLDDTVNLFDEYYTSFVELETYEEYKKFSKKYPRLLPAVYAAKLHDKENYVKFYNYIFDHVMEDNIEQYVNDLKEVGGYDKEGEELRKPFIDEVKRYYDVIVSDQNPFDINYGHGPIHIALTSDSREVANKYCDESKVSGATKESKTECYNYVLHYRATEENDYCEQISERYEKGICYSLFNSKKYMIGQVSAKESVE